jgi:lipopolysaccharide/colanic/teichoic acid biosynthesis glycosyltransferase
MRLPSSSRLIKRAFDVVVATAATLLLAPLFAVIAVAIKLDARGGPVFFRQVRIGARGRPFRIYKFRSMVFDADERKDVVAHLNQHARRGGDPRMFKIAQDPRVTRVGAWLRKYSLDELPQLFNVLRGEMSLVGPRPLIVDEAVHVSTWGQRRLDLKPGITGLWQVAGRSDIPFGEMIQLDYRYVTEWTVGHDFKLLVQTLPAVWRRTGAY